MSSTWVGGDEKNQNLGPWTFNVVWATSYGLRGRVANAIILWCHANLVYTSRRKNDCFIIFFFSDFFSDGLIVLHF